LPVRPNLFSKRKSSFIIQTDALVFKMIYIPNSWFWFVGVSWILQHIDVQSLVKCSLDFIVCLYQMGFDWRKQNMYTQWKKFSSMRVFWSVIAWGKVYFKKEEKNSLLLLFLKCNNKTCRSVRITWCYFLVFFFYWCLY
jgi:hypothetical protein